MHHTDPIRRWRQLGFSTLLCLAWTALATAQTQTPAPPATPPQASPAPAKKKSTTLHASTKTSARTSTHASAQKSKSSRSKRSAKKRGQQAIDSARTREIQQALIREHYLQGQPTGAWDTSTQAAMQRYQQDHGWQSKTTPDARALITLGLGPSHDRLLNPESAMTTTMATRTTTKTPRPAAPPSADPKADPAHAQPDNTLPKN
jgi:hypothetical protein